MKILMTFSAVDYSGAPKMLVWVAGALADRGHDVTILTYNPARTQQPLPRNVRHVCFQTVKSRSRIRRNTWDLFRTLKMQFDFVKKNRFDVIISFLDTVGYVYILANRLFGHAKMIVSERVDPYAYSGLNARLRFFLMSLADCVVFQTEGAQAFFRHRSRKLYSRSRVIPNPVVVKPDISEHLDRFRVRAAQRRSCIVTAGRLKLKQKRQDILIRAFLKVHEKHPELELFIYGEGKDRDRIQKLIDDAHAQSCIFLPGQVTNIEERIFDARLFVLSSDYEGIPNALIEAMLLGVPSVSTDCSPGGAALLIKNGENGFLVPRGDADALSEKMLDLIENPALADRFSDEAPKIQSRFSEAAIGDMWSQLMQEINN